MRDTDDKWGESDFTPADGEIVVYNKTESTPARMRVGDGRTGVKGLKNITGEIYTQAEEPEGAGEGAVWIDLKPLSRAVNAQSDNDGDAFSDWNAEEGEAGHILNRPVFDETKQHIFVGQSLEKGSVIQVSTEVFVYEKMQDLVIEMEGVTDYTIVPDIKRKSWLKEGKGTANTIVFVYGPDLNLSSSSVGVYYLENSETASQIGLFIDSDCEFEEKWYEKGLYIWGTGKSYYVSKLSFNYNRIIFNEKYKNVFKDTKASNVYKLDISELAEQTLTDDLILKVNAEIGKYGSGDILLLPKGLIQLLEGV